MEVGGDGHIDDSGSEYIPSDAEVCRESAMYAQKKYSMHVENVWYFCAIHIE
jgi:hypothetical protein